MVLRINQFGFNKGRSTNDAAFEVRDFRVNMYNRKEYGATLSPDIRNTFNSISWKWILEQIELKMVPSYLKIIRSYLIQRILLFKDPCRHLNSSFPQGSVLGPHLSNIAFDGLLRLRLSPGCRTICYANNTLVLVRAVLPIDLESRMNWALKTVTDWIQAAVLDLAEKQLYLHLNIKRRKYRLYCERR